MKDEDIKNKLLKKYEKELRELKKYSKYHEELNHIKRLYPEAIAYISGNDIEYKYNSYINLVTKERTCTKKDDDLTIEEKKTILSNTLELLEEDINENFNNKINIFPKVHKYSDKVKNVFQNFKEKISISKYNKFNQSKYDNYEERVIILLKKLDRNHIFKYKDKIFYPFIYDIFNTNNFISFKIDEYKNIIKKINSLKDYGNFEVTNNELKDIIQISEIFQAHQLQNLIYILFDDFDSNKEYKSLMKIIFYKNDNPRNVFTNKTINEYSKKLDGTTENTITIYKHFLYS